MTDHQPRILLLEDSPLDAELIREQLSGMIPEPNVTLVTGRKAFTAALEAGDIDLILSDFSLPDFDGMTALEMAHTHMPDTPFIFVSGVLGEEAAIESFRRGATDYVLKQRIIRLPAAVERAMTEARDRREHHRLQQQKEILVRELSHRVKNTMAMVMSIVRRTARSSATVEDYASNLMGRLGAMADAHALLFETNWSRAELSDVISRTITPHSEGRGTRFRIQPGPSAPLDPKASLALSMIINELTTNAVKYGALSNDTGQIDLTWRIDVEAEGPVVALSWLETGGPEASEPEEEGFGATLIRRSVDYELMGSVTIDYRKAGLECQIRFPLTTASAPA